jgi:hypothetical protein
LRHAAEKLRAKGWIAGDVGFGWLTRTGCSLFEKIVAARRAHLAEVFSLWTSSEAAGLGRPAAPPRARLASGDLG